MEDSVYSRALQAVVDGLNTIGLVNFELASDSIQIRRLNPADMSDWKDVTDVGGVTVRYQDDLIESDGTNERDAWGYPCHVCIVRGSRRQLQEETEPIMRLKQEIKRYFNNKRRMDDATDTLTQQVCCTVTDGPKPPPQVVSASEVHTITVIGWFHEARTT